jgi:RIP homotypic interaction motif
MDQITLIVAALAAGASGGAISALQDDVKGAVIAAYGARAGKYNVTIKNAKGVQLGDGNIQVNHF